jgi:hypothetical protein
VPAHWPTGVMNGLIMAVRRGRIDPRDLAALPIRIEPPHAPAAWDAVIRVATKHRLTVYDAAYLGNNLLDLPVPGLVSRSLRSHHAM